MREADITLDDTDFREMGIEELVSMGRAAGLIDLEELVCRGTGAVVQAETESRYDEDRLDELEYVDSWEHVAERDSGHVYVISFTAPELPEELGDRADALLGTCDPDIDDHRSFLNLVGDQAAIADLVAAYEESGISPDLTSLTGYTGGADTADALTDRQREVIETAHELGYYEVPREASTQDIAETLDLDPSTVTEHLQRAERHLINDLL